jgi:hypothetical protein
MLLVSVYVHILVSWPNDEPSVGVGTGCRLIINLFANCVLVVAVNFYRHYDSYNKGGVTCKLYYAIR